MDNFFARIIENKVLKIDIEGDLIGQQNENQILNYVEEQVPSHITLAAVDISKVNHMNSSGLTVLIRLLTRFRNRSGELVLIKPSESVKKLLIITKLSQIFYIFDSEQEAVGFLRRS